MADFAGVINQLKINNEEEKQRDSNLNKNLAFGRDMLQDGLKQLSGQTVQSNNKTNQAIKDASTKQANATKSFGDDQKKEIIKSRKEASAKNKELQSLTGKNIKLMREQEKEDAQFRKELIDVELENPDLNPSKRKELEKERKRLEGNVLKDAFSGLKDAFSDFASPLKKFLGAKTGIPGITVGRFALLAAIPLLIKFLRSQAFQDMINYLKGPGGEVLNQVGAGLKFMLEKIGAFIVSIGSFSKSIQKFMEDPSFENFLGIFSENGTFFVGIAALTALLAPRLLGLATGGVLQLGIKGLGGAIKFAGKRLSFLTKGLAAASGAQLLADGTIKDNNKDKDKDKKKDKDKTKDKTKKVDPKTDKTVTPDKDVDPKKEKDLTKKQTKSTLKKTVAKSGLKVVAGAAKFAGPLGLAIGAGIGVFEGFREGAEEFKQSGELDKAITKGLGGFAESITFGLVDSDAAAEGASFLGRRLGLIDETMDEEVERLKKKIAEAKDRITRSEGGENVYKLMESRGRKMDSIAIRQAEEALQKITQKQSGGFLARGQLAMVGERGAELIMTDSPAQVMSAARTEQLEMAAMNQATGNGMNGATVMVNTGGNTATSVTRSTTFRPSTHLDTNFDRYQKFA